MPPQHLRTALISLLLGIARISTAETEDDEKLEQFVPVGSTTALMCEPIFDGDSSSATWYKDGVAVGSVTSKSNALLANRSYSPEEKVPEVGFLIVSQIRREDEGTYQCRDDASRRRGKPSRLRVAFVEDLPIEGHISFDPRRVVLGESLRLSCPIPAARPVPTATWQLNGSPISRHAPEATAYPNGTLLIPRFKLSHLGLYSCNITNFGGRTTSRVFIDAKDLLIDRTLPAADSSDISQRCTYFFRACVLWFLIGCLATSCLVLLYLLCALCCLQPRRRRTMRPSFFARSHPGLGPGFRKPVVPLPDYYLPAPTQPPAS